MTKSSAKTYLIVKKTTTKGNGEKTEAWEAYKDTFFTRHKIFIYKDCVQFTRADTYEACVKLLYDVTSTEVTTVVAIVEV